MANRTKWTQKKKAAFLDAFRESANVTAAARAAGVSRSRAYQLRDEDPAFAAQWEEAENEAIDALELEMRRRAMQGVEEPVFYQGFEVGTIRRYSDTLAIFLAKAHRPEKYRDRSQTELTGPGGAPLSGPPVTVYLPDNGRGPPPAPPPE